MIGAVLVKKGARSAHDLLNRREIAKFMASYAENATWNLSGNTSISGENKGKKAIEAAMAKMLEQFPKFNFNVKEVFVSNIFALGLTNNIAVEYEVTATNRAGKEFLNRGVAIVRLKGGKVVEVREYIFNTDQLNEAWRKV